MGVVKVCQGYKRNNMRENEELILYLDVLLSLIVVTQQVEYPEDFNINNL